MILILITDNSKFTKKFLFLIIKNVSSLIVDMKNFIFYFCADLLKIFKYFNLVYEYY